MPPRPISSSVSATPRDSPGIGRRVWGRFKLRVARRKLEMLSEFLTPGEHILEIGAGNGALTKWLRDAGYEVTPLDLRNRSLYPSLEVQTYDGSTLPFPDKSFDTVQLITVLHHTPDPEALLREARRVGQRLIVLEDIHANRFQKALTQWTDSLVNLEFATHPHNNKSDAEWREVFYRLDLRITHSFSFPYLGAFRQAFYVLDTQAKLTR